MVLGTLAVMANFLGTNLEGILCMAFMEMVRRSACFECSPERSCRNSVGVFPDRVISTSCKGGTFEIDFTKRQNELFWRLC